MKKTNFLFVLSLALLFPYLCIGQGVKVSDAPGAPDPSAMLDVSSSEKGTLITRMTTAERDAIESPAQSLMIFNLDTKCINVYVDASWLDLCPACTPPSCTAGTNSPVCNGASVNLTASHVPGSIYQWAGPNGFSSAEQNPVLTDVTPAAGGSYSVTVTQNGCTSSPQSVVVIVNPIPDVPMAGIHVSATAHIVWSWNLVPGATGYKYNTVNDYGSATDNGTATAHTQTGLACGTDYTLYVWAYNSCHSAPLMLTQSTLMASGGTITYTGGNTIHTFATSGIFTAGCVSNVEALVVGGGGGAGGSYATGWNSGGGGGGGVIYEPSFAVTAQPYPVTVGAGGIAGTDGGTGTQGQNGGDSVFGSLTAIGGGGGGAAGGGSQSNGLSGGSGGGSGIYGDPLGGGAGTPGQGNNGGGGSNSGSGHGGGGGGAGGVGSTAVIHTGGGAGLTYSIAGSPIAYAAGGDTGMLQANNDGASNTGNGGDGAYGGSGQAGNGGSGIVIIRYLSCPLPEQPGPIAGNAGPCPGTSETYSVAFVEGLTYTWTFPAGWVQTGGGNTGSVTVTTGEASDEIRVFASNNCGDGPEQTLALNVLDAPGEEGHVVTESTIEWNWGEVPGATGYKYNTVNDYDSATDNGTGTTYMQSGISGCGDYALYVWAYNACGSSTVATLTQSTAFSATGGIVSQAGGYTIHTFTTSGTFMPGCAGNVEVLVVAGGGSGGSGQGGGGGGGGLIFQGSYSVTPQEHAVVVGEGGGQPGPYTHGNDGGNSVFGTLVANGGGGGGSYDSPPGRSGGSGGGGGGATPSSVGGAGTAGQGNSGGSETNYSPPYAGGGGGGAGGAGATGPAISTGGTGLSYDISGTATYYAGGGGGSGSGLSAAGGLGGGGTGSSNSDGTPGPPNTGGGGGAGGGNYGGGKGGSGGSGIVIIRY